MDNTNKAIVRLAAIRSRLIKTQDNLIAKGPAAVPALDSLIEEIRQIILDAHDLRVLQQEMADQKQQLEMDKNHANPEPVQNNPKRWH